MTVKLSPVFNDQTFDSNGDPAIGYQLFTYAAGSTTKLATYSDSAGSVPQSNPIILNASGYPTAGPIWLTEGQNYKFVLAAEGDTDPPTSPIRTIDDVSGINDAGAIFSQWASSGVTPTYVSASSFTVSGDQTSEFHVGRRLELTVAAGTVYGTITTSAYGALTTITLAMDAGQVLDASLSAVNLSVLRNDHSALPSSSARSGANTDITSLNSPAIGAATSTTPAAGDNSTKVANTAFGATLAPAGQVAYFGRTAAPAGWLKANGAQVSRATYAGLFSAIGTTFGAGDGSTTFTLPDLRGEFIRSLDDGRGIDAARVIGFWQADALQGHWHDVQSDTAGGGVADNIARTTGNGDAAGVNPTVRVKTMRSDGVNGTPRTAPETRPRNIALLACIKY